MLSDLHIYGGLTVLGVGLGLIHIGIGLAAVGIGLIALGGWYALAEARTPDEAESRMPAEAE